MRHMLGLLALLFIGFSGQAGLAQRVGDRVWVDLEAARVEDDGFAEGLVLSVRPSLVEVQPSRVEMTRPSDLASLLRRGNAFVPAAQVSPLEVGRRNWEARQAVLALQRRAETEVFLPAGPDLQAALRTASEPRNRDRMGAARALLTFLNAMSEPRGAEPRLAGELLVFAREGWTAFPDRVFGSADAFDRAGPALARRAADAVRQLGGHAALDPEGRLPELLRQGDWVNRHGAYRPLPPVPQRILHLIERVSTARFDIVGMAAPDRVVEAIRTLPAWMATLEMLHPDAILTPNAPPGREAMRQAFLARARDDIATAYKERINDEEEVRRLPHRYIEGDEAALATWMSTVTDLTRQVAAALGRPVFDETDRNTLMEMRRAFAAERERREAQQQAAEQRRATIASLGMQVADRWEGAVQCGQGLVPIAFEIARPDAEGRVVASLSYAAPNGVSTAVMQGRLDPATRRITLDFVRWSQSALLADRPERVALTLSETGQAFAGAGLAPNCRPFGLQRAGALVDSILNRLPGTWTGAVTCQQFSVPLSLTLRDRPSAQRIEGTLTFVANNQRGVLEVRGELGFGGRINFETTRWLQRPEHADIRGIEVTASLDGPSLSGALIPRATCQPFTLAPR